MRRRCCSIPVQLDQILMNLAINARDAMQGERRDPRDARRAVRRRHACTSCREQRSAATSSSSPSPTPARAFRRTSRSACSSRSSRRRRSGKGSGMGLATVHGIVHEHGGHIVVETAPGAGASFRILFPAIPHRAASDRHGTPSDDGEASACIAFRMRRRRRRRGVGRRVHAGAARPWGLAVTTFADGRSAFDARSGPRGRSR